MKNRSLTINLAALATGMLMLSFASVPLYRLFCQVTGYGGTTQTAVQLPGKVLERTMNITFNADTDAALPWDFTPGEKIRRVKIGEQGLTYYVAHNRSDKPVKGHAVYNVVPHAAGTYFTKIDCFCFREQTLAAGQKVNMPISFYLDPAMADDPDLKDVETITLSYTFFAVKK